MSHETQVFREHWHSPAGMIFATEHEAASYGRSLANGCAGVAAWRTVRIHETPNAAWQGGKLTVLKPIEIGSMWALYP
jgi:hypothetical protein